MEGFKLNRDEIEEYQRNRSPYLFVDYVEEVIPGASAQGYLDLIESLWFFEVHWPEDPNMPGMLQIEALVQLAALSVLTLPGNKGELVYLTSLENIKLMRKVVPGDRLGLSTEVLSWKRGVAMCKGVGTVNDTIACRAQFSFVMPKIVSAYQVVKN